MNFPLVYFLSRKFILGVCERSEPYHKYSAHFNIIKHLQGSGYICFNARLRQRLAIVPHRCQFLVAENSSVGTIKPIINEKTNPLYLKI